MKIFYKNVQKKNEKKIMKISQMRLFKYYILGHFIIYSCLKSIKNKLLFFMDFKLFFNRVIIRKLSVGKIKDIRSSKKYARIISKTFIMFCCFFTFKEASIANLKTECTIMTYLCCTVVQ